MPKVTLLSHTNKPIETIYAIWLSSRSEDQIDINKINKNDPVVFDTFKKVIDSKIPVSENVEFIFLLEEIPIALREQMVRHRVGTKYGELLGVDIIPDITESSWWSQTMRVKSMSDFQAKENYFIPESIKNNVENHNQYISALRYIELVYNRLIDNGVPAEDARLLIPLAATHRITWKLNLSTLQHVIGNRGCWIAQLGLWEDVITGMIGELANKIHPYFKTLLLPPCIKKVNSINQYTKCPFALDNMKRINGEDTEPVCSLYLSKEYYPNIEKFPKAELTEQEQLSFVPTNLEKRYTDMKNKFKLLWEFDPCTAENIKEDEKEEYTDSRKEGWV